MNESTLTLVEYDHVSPPESELSPTDPDDAVIVSIPFSGTRYLRQALSIPKCVHTYVPPNRLMEYIGGATRFVVPLRDPKENWKSWARRWPEGKPWDKRIAEFERAWMGMAWFLQCYEAEVLTIDDFPKSDIPMIGKEDEGNNSYLYDVSHIYKYDFVKEYL